jgi:hypothetical protein
MFLEDHADEEQWRLLMDGTNTTSRASTTRPRGRRAAGETEPAIEPRESNTQSIQTGSNSSGIVGTVRERATAQLNTQKDRATDGLGTIAQAVRQTTGKLREDQQDMVAQYVEKAADQIERLSNNLREKDVSELLADAQRLARRQPALFIGGSFAAGLLAARFLKSSNEARTNAEYIAEPSVEYTRSTDYTEPSRGEY